MSTYEEVMAMYETASHSDGEWQTKLAKALAMEDWIAAARLAELNSALASAEVYGMSPFRVDVSR